MGQFGNLESHDTCSAFGSDWTWPLNDLDDNVKTRKIAGKEQNTSNIELVGHLRFEPCLNHAASFRVAGPPAASCLNLLEILGISESLQ